MISIPPDRTIDIKHIVCDYNGTIAKDGILLPQVGEYFQKLHERYQVHVITADTFGSVRAQLAGLPCEIKILSSSDHTAEKAAFVRTLGAENTLAIGNGSNDAKMLHEAAVGIALLGDEGCSKAAWMAADIVCKSIDEALELVLFPKRLIATLRT